MQISVFQRLTCPGQGSSGWYPCRMSRSAGATTEVKPEARTIACSLDLVALPGGPGSSVTRGGVMRTAGLSLSPASRRSSCQHLCAWGPLLGPTTPCLPCGRLRCGDLLSPGSRLSRTPAVVPLGWGLSTSTQGSLVDRFLLPTVGASTVGGRSITATINHLLFLFSLPCPLAFTSHSNFWGQKNPHLQVCLQHPSLRHLWPALGAHT